MDEKKLGWRIQKVRAGVSRENFAEKLGVTPLTVSRYEKEERTPDADFLLKLIDFFKCDPTWLLTGEAPKAPSYPPEIQDTVSKLVSILDRADPETKGFIKGVIESEYRKVKKESIKTKKGA